MRDSLELLRLKILCVHEEEARAKGYTTIVGVDEAGRGPLAGPVVAAACHIPEGLFLEGIDDSKKLTAAQRDSLFKKIASSRVTYSVGIVDAARIDEINILQATFEAMRLAVNALQKVADFLLIDGSLFPEFSIPGKAIIGGDALSQSIAAASIVAKETRDRLMQEYHTLWPEYGFAQHKGYPTKAHRKALMEFGPSPIHRRSFNWGIIKND